jgi:predicted nicotinamide N-methyase|tara:strand:- start:247 stop:1194 length:948 start_codon:yes stop_codon:yes gene_type:complete
LVFHTLFSFFGGTKKTLERELIKRDRWMKMELLSRRSQSTVPPPPLLVHRREKRRKQEEPRVPSPTKRNNNHPRELVPSSSSSSSSSFETITEEVVVFNEMTVHICRPKSENAVIEYYIEKKQLDADPYWAALWPSACALSAHLALMHSEDETTEPSDSEFSGKTVCELGCGLGLVGLTLAKLGAKSVTLFDREPLCLECANASAKLNGVENIVKTEVLDWNAPADENKLNSFDILVAADVLYEKHAVEPVSEFCSKFVKANGGRIFIADPPLRAPQNRELFKKIMVEEKQTTLVSEKRKIFACNEVLILELTPS